MTMIIVIVMVEPINASPGKLRGASIVTCNGVTYGVHSSDNHWHKAVDRGNGRYPDGDIVSATNPCASAPTPAPKPTPNAPAPKKETIDFLP